MPDAEQLGAEARSNREKATEAAIHVELDKGNCSMFPVVAVDGRWVPLSTVLTLPVAIRVSSK